MVLRNLELDERVVELLALFNHPGIEVVAIQYEKVEVGRVPNGHDFAL